MYSDLSFASQEANPLDSFTTLYTDSADDDDAGQRSTFRRTPSSASAMRSPPFNYDVTFHTRLLGDFTDANRNLTLVVDDRAQANGASPGRPTTCSPICRAARRLRLDPTIPNRANIYDRNGQVLADQNGRVVRLQVVRAADSRLRQLPERACIGARRAGQRCANPARSPPANWLIDVGEIDPQTYTATHQALTRFLRASTFKEQPTRRYITGAVTSHIIGYVGYPDEAICLRSKRRDSTRNRSSDAAASNCTWDEDAARSARRQAELVTPAGAAARTGARSAPKPGESLWLTIDADLQRKIAQIVADAYTQAKDGWGPGSHGASVVVMNPNTGEILAMVSYPSFDNNAYQSPSPAWGSRQAQRLIQQYQTDPRNPEVNRPTQGIYPLGSTMKTVTAAAAADSGVYALNQSYVCTGIWTRDITRYDWLSAGAWARHAGKRADTKLRPLLLRSGLSARSSRSLAAADLHETGGIWSAHRADRPARGDRLHPRPGLVAHIIWRGLALL